MKSQKIVWGLKSLGQLEEKSKLIAKTLEKEAKLMAETLEREPKFATDVAENTSRNKNEDLTLKCVHKACKIHALAGIKKDKKRVRFPDDDNNLAVMSEKEGTRYFHWRNRSKTVVYLEDLATSQIP